MTEFTLEPPAPWDEAVDGDALLDGIMAAVNRYLVLPDGGHEVLALWAVHAHAVNCFRVSPRLHIRSPVKQCGKTRVLQILEMLTPKAVRSENVTAAVVARIMEGQQPTLLIDEVDTFLRNKDNAEVVGALNAGHLAGGVHLKCEGEKSKAVRAFKCYGPVAMAGIKRITDTLEDRSVILTLRRRKPDEKIMRFRAHKASELPDLCRMAARWVQDNQIGLSGHEPVLPNGLDDRPADNWEPLLTIADLAGGDWPERVRQIALTMTRIQADDDESVGVMLLADLRELFGTEEKMSSSILAERLSQIEGRPWGDWGKPPKAISPNQVARLLRHFAIRPSKIRIGADTCQGYRREQFEDSWAAFLSSSPLQAGTMEQIAESVDKSRSVWPEQEPERYPERENRQSSAECSSVPVQGEGDEDGDLEERAAIEAIDGETDLTPPDFLRR